VRGRSRLTHVGDLRDLLRQVSAPTGEGEEEVEEEEIKPARGSI